MMAGQTFACAGIAAVTAKPARTIISAIRVISFSMADNPPGGVHERLAEKQRSFPHCLAQFRSRDPAAFAIATLPG
jgi:hypothetical protein